jgi:hypothetical protein
MAQPQIVPWSAATLAPDRTREHIEAIIHTSWSMCRMIASVPS